MAKYGRFTGGTHFKKLKNRKINLKKTKVHKITEEQLLILKELGLNFQANSMTFEKAQQLINKLKGKNENQHKET